MGKLPLVTHMVLLGCFSVCVLVGALPLAVVLAGAITYWYRAYGVAVALILIDATLGSFTGMPWLSLCGLVWLIVSEVIRPLLAISTQDTV